MNNIYTAGNTGPKVKSDCQVSLILTENNGIKIDLKSKVEKYFANHFNKLITETLKYFGIENCEITIVDTGALDYVILARLESVANQAMNNNNNFLPNQNKRDVKVAKDSFRRSRLYLPGNTPKFFINAGLYESDGIIFDLEDSVAPEKKDEARIMVRNAIIAGEYYNSEIMVRINQLPLGLKDLEYVIPFGVDTILLPKCESAEQIIAVEEKIKELKKVNNITKDIFIMPIIESAMGVMKSFEIASASENIIALTIGLEDYTADLGVQRTDDAQESEFARAMLVNAAKAVGILAIDSVFSDVGNMEKLSQTAKRSKAMGFDGMGCIHPRQIIEIHKAFSPTEKEVEKAKKIILAFNQAKKEGKGVISLNSKMIDPPVVKRAEDTIKLAIMNKMLEENWEEKDND